MNDMQILLDPTAEQASTRRARLAPPDHLEGKTVALLDIGKLRGDEFLDRLQILLEQQGIAIRRYIKPTNVKIAPVSLLQKIAGECDVVVEALAD